MSPNGKIGQIGALGAATLLALALPATRLAAAGADTWGKDCAMCHGKDGVGNTKAGHLKGVKDLTDAGYQKSFTDAAAFTDVKEGLQKDGHAKMNPFKDKLSDDEITAVVAYVRTLAK